MEVNGQWRGGCRARLLASALTLRLLQERAVHREAQQVLVRYCDAELAAFGPSGSQRFDPLFSAVLASAVLNKPDSTRNRCCVVAMMDRDQHTIHPRKKAVLQPLLARVLPNVAPVDQAMLKALASDPGIPQWVVLILAALRLEQDPSPNSPDLSLVVNNQDVDGGWQGHVLATVMILLSLSRVGLADGVVDRGIRFLLELVGDRGGVPFIRDQDTWITALAALTVAEADASVQDLELPRRYLCAAQLPDSGWSYADGVTQADADDSAVAVTFLGGYQHPDAAQSIRAGLAYLMNLQNSDGGFPTFVRGAGSDSEITAKCIHALVTTTKLPGFTAHVQHDIQQAVGRAWQWLRAQQCEDGGFTREWSISPLFPVLHVVRAVRAAHLLWPDTSLSDDERVVDACVRFVVDSELSGGGWSLYGGSSEVNLLSTAYAVNALASAPRPPTQPGDRVIERWLRLLTPPARVTGDRMATTCRPGEVCVEADSLGPRPFVYDVPLLWPIYRLAALTSVARQRAEHIHSHRKVIRP